MRGRILGWVLAGLIGLSSIAGANVSAQPAPDEVVGAPSPGGTLTVRGSNFGSRGPDIVLFEDFESARPGSVVPLDGPPIGRWEGSHADPTIVDDARSGNGAMLAYGNQTQRQLTLKLPRKEREIFVSFWVRIPPGSHFPGRVGGPRQFSSDSSWKMSWLMNTEQGFHSNQYFDICLPTFTGGPSFQLGGNSYLAADRYLGDNWWSWNHWIRVSTWIRNPLEKRPGGVFEALSEDRGYYRRDFGSPTDRIALRDQTFDIFNIPGWIRGGGGDRVRPLYDDIYVAAGAGAAARVELANSPRYEDATRIELLLVQSWSAAEVSAELPRSARVEGETWYVFVTDAEGRRNASGLSLCGNCPKPPRLSIG